MRSQFESLEAVETAVEKLKDVNVEEYEVYSPVLPHESIERYMPRKGSFVRWVSSAGGVTGLFLGFLMCYLSSKLFNLYTSAKPPVSWVPFVVVGFECTILFAAVATVLAFAYFARLKPMAPPAEYSPRFGNDRYGLYVQVAPERTAVVARILQEAGAVEVTEGEAASA